MILDWFKVRFIRKVVCFNREQSSNVWLITLGVAKKPQASKKRAQFDVGHPVVFKR